MRIGILTYHASLNYGAFLQAYSLACYVQETMHCQVEIIDYNSKVAQDYYKVHLREFIRDPVNAVFQINKIREFSRVNNPFLSAKSLVSDDMTEIKHYIESLQYDVIIVGSDEIWKLNGFRGFPNAYWLPGISGCKKMAYAASGRNEYDALSEDVKQRVYTLLQDFSYIGLRDSVTKNLIDRILMCEKETHLNCDPTFLHDFGLDKNKCREKLVKQYNLNPEKKVLCVAVESPAIRKMMNRNLLKSCQVISLFKYLPGTKGFAAMDPFEWMEAIAGSDGLITTFFHGMVFAIKNHTPFFIIEGRKIPSAAYSKSFDLLERNGVESHFHAFHGRDRNALQRDLHGFVNQINEGTFVFPYDQFLCNEKERGIHFAESIRGSLE